MSILNFMSQDDLDDLDENPQVAFMELVNIAQRSLSSQTSRLDGQDESQWEEREELRHSFMNVVVAAAKRFGVEPFASMEVPTYSKYKTSIDHREFRADLDHYVTQVVIDNSLRRKTESVEILPSAKGKIRNYINALRDCIRNASLSDSKRDTLLKRLDEFDAELEKRRVNMVAVARITFELLAIPGNLWASHEVMTKLVNNVMQTVAEARSAEHETRELPPAAPLKALSPPRTETFGRKGGGRITDVVDDDIPF